MLLRFIWSATCFFGLNTNASSQRAMFVFWANWQKSAIVASQFIFLQAITICGCSAILKKSWASRLFREPMVKNINGKIFFIGHGDGKGPKDFGYKILKKIFANRLCQWLFGRLHPNFGIWLANQWISKSKGKKPSPPSFHGIKHEWLYQYATKKSKSVDIDYFIFGHRHLPINCQLPNQKVVILIWEIGYSTILMQFLTEWKCKFDFLKAKEKKYMLDERKTRPSTIACFMSNLAW